MTLNSSLEQSQLEQAFALLEREQGKYLPTRWQLFVYYSLAAVAVVLVAAWIVVALYETEIYRVPEFILGVADTSLVVSAVASAVLICANGPLLLLLQRHEQLRCRLELERDVVKYLAEPSRRLTLIVTVISSGVALLLMGWIGVQVSGAGKFLTLVPCSVTVLTLLMVPLIESGRSRMQAVQELRRTLEKEVARPSGGDVEVEEATVQKVAALERLQIARERQRSLDRSRTEGASGPYAVQQSRAVTNTKSELDFQTRMRVDDGIIALAAAPPLHPGRVDPTTELAVASISGTGLDVGYQVDHQARRVRVYYITRSAPPEET